MDLLKFFGERRGCYTVTDFPTRRVIGLAERRHHKAALVQIRIAAQTHVFAPVEDDVLVDLVRQEIQIVLRHERSQRVDVVGGPHGTGGVVRRVGYDQSGSWRDEIGHSIPIHSIGRRVERHVARHPALQRDYRFIAVVGRIENDDLVARVHDRGDGTE